jgi:hypothetical protein
MPFFEENVYVVCGCVYGWNTNTQNISTDGSKPIFIGVFTNPPLWKASENQKVTSVI